MPSDTILQSTVYSIVSSKLTLFIIIILLFLVSNRQQKVDYMPWTPLFSFHWEMLKALQNWYTKIKYQTVNIVHYIGGTIIVS